MTKNTAIMSKTVEILGEQAGYYLSHVCRTIDKKSLYLPGPDTVDRIWAESDRSVRTLGSLQWILSNGRLGGTGYVSILPVDQGIEHSAGASFAPNPAYFDPEHLVRLAVEGGCNAVASTVGVLGAVALMLALNRTIHRAYWRTRDGNFSLHGLMGFDMYGKTAGIVGTGRIARELIRILKGFGMEVVANDLFPDPQYAAEAGIAYVPLDELYARADIVSLHCPLTDRTRYMIGDAAISRMKPGVILINTGRGQLIHTEALIDGLKEKKIGAAGLDVYEEEAGYFYEDTSDRIMDDDVLARLLSFNNVIVTSHQGFFTREAVDNIARTTMQNIKDFSECRRLENEVRAEPENAVGQL